MKIKNTWFVLSLALVLGACGSGSSAPASSDGETAQSCTATRVDGGVEIDCGDTSATVYDGEAGQDGSDGSDGSDGTDGSDGSDGSSGSSDGCSITDTPDGVDITCGETTTAVYDGQDAETTVTSYEPVLALDAGAGSVPQYSSVTGHYVQIDNIVFVDINANGDGGAEGTTSAYLTVTLPIRSSASVSTYTGAGILENGTDIMSLQARVPSNSDIFYLAVDDATNPYVRGQDQNNTTRYFHVSFFYYVD